MTPSGKRCIEILLHLEEQHPDREGWFTAQEVTELFGGLDHREKPVMTVSSYLTHAKRTGYVERKASSDKLHAWWRVTKKGRKAVA